MVLGITPSTKFVYSLGLPLLRQSLLLHKKAHAFLFIILLET